MCSKRLCYSCYDQQRNRSNHKKRKLKGYDECSTTTKWERRTKLKKSSDTIQCPLSAVQPTIPESELIHLSTATRNQMRTVPSIKLPSEKKIVELKKELVVTHGTGTSKTNFNGFIFTYLNDPLLFIQHVTKESKYISIGGDTGGGTTKLGITYTNVKGVEEFSPLLITNEKDSWDYLKILAVNHLFKYTGETEKKEIKNIWQLFQHINDHSSRQINIYLNGDWIFLNVVRGLMSPSSLQPCPICVVNKNNFQTIDRNRPLNPFMEMDCVIHQALLTISSRNVIPAPLHIFLGIGNRIINQILPNIIEKNKLKDAIKSVKSVYAHTGSGLQHIHELNGPELSKFINKDWDFLTDENSIILFKWIKQLQKFLLQKQKFTQTDINEFELLVNEIITRWSSVTGQELFPKLHLLLHCVQFVKVHFFLGKFNESQIESFHSQFNRSTKHTHNNQGKNIGEKLRRSLADMALKHIRNMLL